MKQFDVYLARKEKENGHYLRVLEVTTNQFIEVRVPSLKHKNFDRDFERFTERMIEAVNTLLTKDSK